MLHENCWSQIVSERDKFPPKMIQNVGNNRCWPIPMSGSGLKMYRDVSKNYMRKCKGKWCVESQILGGSSHLVPHNPSKFSFPFRGWYGFRIHGSWYSPVTGSPPTNTLTEGLTSRRFSGPKGHCSIAHILRLSEPLPPNHWGRRWDGPDIQLLPPSSHMFLGQQLEAQSQLITIQFV